MRQQLYAALNIITNAFSSPYLAQQETYINANRFYEIHIQKQYSKIMLGNKIVRAYEGVFTYINLFILSVECFPIRAFNYLVVCAAAPATQAASSNK